MRYRPDEHFSITAVARMRNSYNGIYNLINHLVWRDNLDSCFLHILDEFLAYRVRRSMSVFTLFTTTAANGMLV